MFEVKGLEGAPEVSKCFGRTNNLTASSSRTRNSSKLVYLCVSAPQFSLASHFFEREI